MEQCANIIKLMVTFSELFKLSKKHREMIVYPVHSPIQFTVSLVDSKTSNSLKMSTMYIKLRQIMNKDSKVTCKMLTKEESVQELDFM